MIGQLLRRFKPVTPPPARSSGPRLNFFANLEETWILRHFSDAIMAGTGVPYNPVHHSEWPRLRGLPAYRDASGNFFIHYALYRDYLQHDAAGADVVFFTHFYPHTPEGAQAERAGMVDALRRARLVISMSSYGRDRLVEWGVPAEKIVVELVGSDAARFRPGPAASRARPRVGLVSGFKENKNPLFIRDAVTRHGEVDWLLLGRHWERTPLLDELRACRNFQYLDLSEAAFDRWPDVYRGLDLFVTPSLVEGGPVPLLEAMLTGVWPIASDTGHARDVIRDGMNGFVFPVDDRAAFDRRLEESLSLYAGARERVRESVLSLTWERFGRGVDRRVSEALALGASR